MIKAVGTKLMIGANSVTDLTSISGIEMSKDTMDSTTLDSLEGWRTFIGGLKDGGEVGVSGFFAPSDTTGQIEMYNAFNDDNPREFKILFPGGIASWSFQGIVTGFNTGAELEDGLSFEGTIKVSGKPVLGLTPSSGLTALALTGAGGALSPAFANGIYGYAYTGLTAASITVTATAANHEIALYVDGVFSQKLTSGSASASIPVAIGSKKLTLLAAESGKTAKAYEIIVTKSA